MLSAIAASTFSGPSGAGPSGAGLDYQLAKYQSQLADWQNCPSCNTPEGKAKIQEISAKIDDITQRLKASDVGASSVAVGNSPLNGIGTNAISPLNAAANAGNDSSRASPWVGAAGGRVDVFV